jgi:parvulin-like peptidyl-prolyl isomerase
MISTGKLLRWTARAARGAAALAAGALAAGALAAAGCATGAPAPEPPATSRAAPSTAPAAASTAPAAEPEGPVVAWVAGRPVTAAALRAEMERRGGRIPGQYQTVEQRRALLDEMIADLAMAETARRQGLDQDPEFRAAFDRMLVQRFEQAHLEPRLEAVEVGEAEIAAYYAAHQDEFRMPERARAAWIFVDVPKRADEAKRAALERRAGEARQAALKLPAATPGFGALAIEYSDDPATRYTGGEIGWVHPGQGDNFRYGPEVLEAALALKAPGELSPVVRTEHGYALVRLVAREEAAPTPLDKLRPRLRNLLLREKREAVRREFHRGLLAALESRIDEAALAAVEPLSAADAPPNEPPALPAD